MRCAREQWSEADVPQSGDVAREAASTALGGYRVWEGRHGASSSGSEGVLLRLAIDRTGSLFAGAVKRLA